MILSCSIALSYTVYVYVYITTFSLRKSLLEKVGTRSDINRESLKDIIFTCSVSPFHSKKEKNHSSVNSQNLGAIKGHAI